METRTTILNFQPSTAIPVVHVSQYDVGVLLRFILYDGAEMAELSGGSSSSVVMTATRPSGTGFSVECTIIATNIVEVETTREMTLEFGIIDAEIRYSNSGVDVGTGNFKFNVEAASHPDYIIDEDHAEWVRIAQEVATDRADAESAARQAQVSANSASTSASAISGAVDSAVAAAATATAAKNDAVTAKNDAVTAKNNAQSSATAAASSAAAAAQSATDAQNTLANTVRYDVTQTKTSEQMATARQNIGAAALTHIANVYSSSSTYDIGDLVLYNYNGVKLYMCTTAIATPEAWTPAHWTEANITDGLAALKGDLNELDAILDITKVVDSILTASDLENGALNADGMNTSSLNYRVRTSGYISVPENALVYIETVSSKDVYNTVFLYDKNDFLTPKIRNTYWQKDGKVKIPSGVKYIRIVFSIAATTDQISPSDITSITVKHAEIGAASGGGLLDNFTIDDNGYICQKVEVM